jgi:hypothetical protein
VHRQPAGPSNVSVCVFRRVCGGGVCGVQCALPEVEGE